MTMRIRDKLATLLVVGLAAAAINQQFQQPRGKRTWNGRVGGVPYDFRPPSADRLRNAVWNPDDARLFVPHPVGMGWTLNLGRFAEPRTRRGRRDRRRAERDARRLVGSR